MKKIKKNSTDLRMLGEIIVCISALFLLVLHPWIYHEGDISFGIMLKTHDVYPIALTALISFILFFLELVTCTKKVDKKISRLLVSGLQITKRVG